MLHQIQPVAAEKLPAENLHLRRAIAGGAGRGEAQIGGAQQHLQRVGPGRGRRYRGWSLEHRLSLPNGFQLPHGGEDPSLAQAGRQRQRPEHEAGHEGRRRPLHQLER